MNMKKLVTLFFLCLLVSAHLTGQISHGGRPLPMTILSTRSGSLFQEMPAFDIAEQSTHSTKAICAAVFILPTNS